MTPILRFGGGRKHRPCLVCIAPVTRVSAHKPRICHFRRAAASDNLATLEPAATLLCDGAGGDHPHQSPAEAFRWWPLLSGIKFDDIRHYSDFAQHLQRFFDYNNVFIEPTFMFTDDYKGNISQHPLMTMRWGRSHQECARPSGIRRYGRRVF
jgi:hypothetical protein